ncbi:MAG: hypothetical protein ABFD49_01085 [Armatimonadota bacterium]|nr:hypothetical protein [bacterium]
MNARWLCRILPVLMAILVIDGQAHALQTRRPLNILFIGNSHTYFNDLPGVFRRIASSSGRTTPNVNSSAFGRYTLLDHLKNARTLRAIDYGWGAYHKPWDFVVLQEHSAIPAWAEDNAQHRHQFETACTQLYDRIKLHNPDAKVVLFETAAWNGAYWRSMEISDTSIGRNATDMQDRVRKWCAYTAYTYVPTHCASTRKNDLKVAFVGDAWERNYNNPNRIMLHAADYYHPNYAGTYLGALVMYATIYNEKTQRIGYAGMLNATTAGYLQRIAMAGNTIKPKAYKTQKVEGKTSALIIPGITGVCLLLILIWYARQCKTNLK